VISRIQVGAVLTPAQLAGPACHVDQQGNCTDAPATHFVDGTELPNETRFEYFARATFDDEDETVSGKSNSQFIRLTGGALDDPPVAFDYSFTTNEDTLYTGNVITGNSLTGTKPSDGDTVSATSTSGNPDTDRSRLRAKLVTGPSHASAFALNPDGSFSYTPAPDYENSAVNLCDGHPCPPPDTFTYKLDDGVWMDGTTPMSPDSNLATVTITVRSRHTTTTIDASSAQSIYHAPVTFTARVIPDSPQLGVPGGVVTFVDDTTGAVLGTPALQDDGVDAHSATATLTISSLAPLTNHQTHQIRALYCGDDTSSYCDPQHVFYQSASADRRHDVTYNLCLLYDPTKVNKLGNTVPIKTMVCDANGVNLSSSALVLHAAWLLPVTSATNGTLDDSGYANPDFDFRYDSSLAGYIYNLSTKGLSQGKWQLLVTAGGTDVLVPPPAPSQTAWPLGPGPATPLQFQIR
jgi:hypothetical protein